MNETKARLLSESQAEQLLQALKSAPNAESIVFALAEIAESIDKIYNEIVPDILAAQSASDQEVKEKLWTLREEVRHIEYHIQDSNLAE